MTIYSHSRISTFEQCSYKYKLQYIDKIRVPFKTIEAFMGDLVHRTLEKLYRDLKFEKKNSKDDLLKFYENLWESEFTDDIIIVKKNYSPDNYRDMGSRYISNYYDRFDPFDNMTILGLETQDKMELADGNSWHVRIDKLGCVGNVYYVCDYKTNSSMKDQAEADSDRQLALYSRWVSEKYPDASKVILLWHMLAFDKDVTSERSSEELKKLESETVSKIAEIENASEFSTNVSALCNYCSYKTMCPEFTHSVSTPELQEDGSVLVDEFERVSQVEKEAKNKKSQIKKKLIDFAVSNGYLTVFGSDSKVSVKEQSKVVMPTDRSGLIEQLKLKGLYDDIVDVSYPKLNSLVVKKGIDLDVQIVKDYRVSLSKR